MNTDETLKICRFAKALSPAQAIDEYQPEAWHLVLRHWRYIDATDALEQLGGEQEWIHVSHIVKRIKAIRRQRVLDYGTLPDPPRGLDPDDTAAYERHIADTTRAIADGALVKTDEPTAITVRDVIGELGHVGKPVDAAPPTASETARDGIRRARAETHEREAAKKAERHAATAARETEGALT